MGERNKRKDKLARNFTEGWVEFNSKRVAKDVASNLNLTQVGGKKRAKSHDVIWNIKYLPGFKWTNLSERLAYEKAVHQQRMRTEISQAKKETDETIKKRKRLEQAQKKLSQPAEEVKSSKQEIHSDKIKKSVKEAKNKKANFPTKTL